MRGDTGYFEAYCPECETTREFRPLHPGGDCDEGETCETAVCPECGAEPAD